MNASRLTQSLRFASIWFRLLSYLLLIMYYAPGGAIYGEQVLRTISACFAGALILLASSVALHLESRSST